MNKFFVLLLLSPLVSSSEAFSKVPQMNEYLCEIEGMSFNLNWDENPQNYKSLIAIDKPKPKIGPIKGEISIAPITTGSGVRPARYT